MNRSNRGESFVETLISMFIIALGMVILSTAISLSARMNAQANSKSELSFANLEGLSSGGSSAQVNGNSGYRKINVDVDVDVNLYTTESGGSNEKMYFYVFS